MDTEVKVKGRKPKAKKVPEQQPVLVEEPVVVQEPVVVIKEKKGRVKKDKKPIQVVAIITPDGIEGTFTPEPRRPLIVHFPFNTAEVNFSDKNFHYDPAPPPQVEPYDDGCNYFQVNGENSSDEIQIGVEKEGWKMVLEEQLKTPAPSTPVAPVVQKPATNYMQEVVEKSILMSCYSVKTGQTFTPPPKTDVQCFWCTNKFDGIPSFLPVKEENGVYHVYGNYCTPQCGLAYLLKEHLDSHVRWERMALLHRMYKAAGRLYPAPPRESLVQYGGIYTYEKFCEIINENKVRVDVQVPPMLSILGTLDTKPIDFYDSSIHNTFTQGFSMDRFKAWSEQGGALRLKRSKPLKDHDSTLDACINISIKRGIEA